MQKGGLEIVYNLEWKNKLCYGEEKSNMVGIVDDPANALDYVTFKTYLLKNSGSSVGIDHVRVSYTKNGQEYFIDTSVAFERALSTFRRRAKAGKVTTLTLEYVNPVYLSKQCDVKPPVDHGEKNTTPPEWFTTYMTKFKEDLIKEISAKFAGKIYKTKGKTKEPAATSKIGDKNNAGLVPFSAKDEAKPSSGNVSSNVDEPIVAVKPCLSKDDTNGSTSTQNHKGLVKISNLDRAQKRKHHIKAQLSSNVFKNPISSGEGFNVTKSYVPVDCRQKGELKVKIPSSTNEVKNTILPSVTVTSTLVDCPQKRELKVEIPLLTFDDEIIDELLNSAIPDYDKDTIYVYQKFGTKAESLFNGVSSHHEVETTQTGSLDCIQEKEVKQDIPSTSNEATIPTCCTLKEGNILDVDFVNCDQLQKTREYGGENCKFNWSIKNTGIMSWTTETEVRYAWGSVELKPLNDKIPCPHLKPGETGAICMDVMLPLRPGEYMCHFQFYHQKEVFGKWFGIEVKIDQHTNQQCTLSSMFDVLNIHGAYELDLPCAWSTYKPCNRVELKQTNMTVENIMDREVTSSKFDPPDNKSTDMAVSTNMLVNAKAIEQSEMKIIDDSLNITTNDEITHKINEQVHIVTNTDLEDHTVLQVEQDNKQFEKKNTDYFLHNNTDNIDNIEIEWNKYSSDIKEDLMNGQFRDCELLDEVPEDCITNTKDDFCMLSDDDRSIISIPDSFSSEHSRPSEEFIHLSSPAAEFTNDSQSENENILQQFEDLDEFPKVEIVIPNDQLLHNDVMDRLDDAINDTTEENQVRSCNNDNAKECDEVETHDLNSKVIGNCGRSEDTSVVTSSCSSDSTTEFAYVIYDGEKIPVSKKYLRQDYLVTAEEVPLELVQNIDTLLNHNLLSENSTISECSYQRLHDSAKLATSNTELPNLDEPSTAVHMSNIEYEVLTTSNSEHLKSTPYRNLNEYSNTLGTEAKLYPSIPKSDRIENNPKKHVIHNTDSIAWIESTKPSIRSSDLIGYDHKKRKPDPLRTKTTKSYISNARHIKNDRKKRPPINNASVTNISTHQPVVDLVDSIEPLWGGQSTVCDLRTKSSTTKQCTDAHYGNHVTKHEAPLGHVKPYVSALKRQIVKFRRSLSSGISEAVDMIPDVLDQAKTDGYKQDGQSVSLDPSKHEELALKMLREMGFQNETYNSALLIRYNYDLNKVITELLSYLE